MAREEVLIFIVARLPDYVTWNSIPPLGTWASKLTGSTVMGIQRGKY